MCNVAYGLQVRLDTPAIVYRSDEAKTLRVGNKVEGYIKVSNSNDYPINVSFEPAKDLNVRMIEDSILLAPNDVIERKYTLKLEYEGTYTSGINVIYSGDGKSFTLQHKITTVNIQKDFINDIVIICALVIVFLTICFVFITRRENKRKQQDEINNLGDNNDIHM